MRLNLLALGQTRLITIYGGCTEAARLLQHSSFLAQTSAKILQKLMDGLKEQGVPVKTSRWGDQLEEGKKRPSILKYSNNHKFRPNDPVRIKATTAHGLRGPYTIAGANGDKYTLEHPNGSKVDNGREFSESELDHAT